MNLPDPEHFKLDMKQAVLQSLLLYETTYSTDIQVLEKMHGELDGWDAMLETFAYEPYKKECLEVAPFWLFKEASEKALKQFKKITAWDNRNHTLVFKIFNYEGELISLKRRRYLGGKWITYKGTHPNRQCMIRIENDMLPVFVIEGHHDALSATLLDVDDIITFNFIMIPTSSYKRFGEVEVGVLRGRNVYFLPDIGDKGDNGIRCMQELASQIEGDAAHTRVVNLRAFLKENGIDANQERLDLSDALFLWEEGGNAFINTLLYYCDRGIVYEGEVF